MKTYKIEPTYKKSVCEVEIWRRKEDIQPSDKQEDCRYFSWKGPVLRRECWWRWAEFSIKVPETESEILDFCTSRGFDSLQAFLDYHGGLSIEDVLLPDEDDDSVILPPEAECHFCWDGQGEEFCVELTADCRESINEEKREKIKEESQRVYYEEEQYECGLEELGWDHYSTIYEIDCALKCTLEEPEEEDIVEQDDDKDEEEEILLQMNSIILGAAAA